MRLFLWFGGGACCLCRWCCPEGFGVEEFYLDRVVVGAHVDFWWLGHIIGEISDVVDLLSVDRPFCEF